LSQTSLSNANNATPDAAPESGDEHPEPTTEGGGAIGDTAGTGTIIALGCISGTIFLIVLGVIYLLITQLLG
jgi:hypothetical protein